MTAPRHNDIRCFCARQPLLAMYGVDKDKRPFIHIRVYKQQRLYAEVYIDGDAGVQIRCRDCFRMHKVRIISGRPVMELLPDSSDTRGAGTEPSDVAPAAPVPVR